MQITIRTALFGMSGDCNILVCVKPKGNGAWRETGFRDKETAAVQHKVMLNNN